MKFRKFELNERKKNGKLREIVKVKSNIRKNIRK